MQRTVASDHCLISALPSLDHSFCTPFPLVSKFCIPLCPSNNFVIQGDIFEKKSLFSVTGQATKKGLLSLADQVLGNIT